MVEAEWIANSHYPFANLDVVGISERSHRQVMAHIDLEQRDIGLVIAADHLGGVVVTILQRDRYLVRIFDHVVVGQDIALFGNDEAGAERFPALTAKRRRRIFTFGTAL